MVTPNREIGPGVPVFNGNELGQISTMKFGATWAVVETKTASFGVTPKDGIHGGVEFAVESELAEVSLATLGIVIPVATVAGTRLTVNNAAGLTLSDIAGVLIYKPTEENGARTDEDEWVTFPKAAPVPDFENEYQGEGGQRMFKVIWKIYPVSAADLATGGRLYNSGTAQWTAGDLVSWGPVIDL